MRSIDAAAWRAACWQARYEILAVSAIGAAGLFLRVWHLSGTPPGLHGDEASTGLEATRIIHHGWIGVYDLQHGWGQPAAAEYWTAGLVWLFHNDTFMIRLAMALAGAATLPLA